MKYLFIVQGEGRGHLTQAIALSQILRNGGHDVVEVMVGKSRLRELPDFFIQKIQAPVHRFESPNFLPTPRGKRPPLVRSTISAVAHLPKYIRSMRYLDRRIRQSGADCVINFYELLTGLTYAFLRPPVPQICIGHQYIFLHPEFEFPQRHKMELALLKCFTRATSVRAEVRLALSLRFMDDDPKQRICVVPPLLRDELFRQQPCAGNYIHGYLLNDGLSRVVNDWHRQHPDVPLHFFWDRKGAPRCSKVDATLSYYRLDDEAFLQRMARCKAFASTAGFESVCEAMYLGKPILMYPVHIEQECNALDASRNGAGVPSHDFNMNRLLEFATHYHPNDTFQRWVRSAPYTFCALLAHYAHQKNTNVNDMFLVEDYI